MSRSLSCIAVMLAVFAISDSAWANGFNLGREATAQEVAAWDIDVRPDGQGLPDGRGSVAAGEKIYAEKCASCHGDFGEGRGRWPALAGGQGSLRGDDPQKTIGSYWPFLSTVFDYTYRAMPFGDAQSLTADEVFAVTAYLLNANDLVATDFILSRDNFTSIRLPNEKNFIADPRPDTATLAVGEPCMRDCKHSVEITMRARTLNVTPAAQDATPAPKE